MPDIESWLVASLITTVLIIFYVYYIKAYHVVASEIDGKRYSVLTLNNSQEAANMLSKVNLGVAKLAEHLQKKYSRRNSMVNNLLDRYNPDVLYESVPTWFNDGVAYTAGKGKSIYICLREVSNGNLHDLNTVMFVALHEISHIATDARHHPKEFWQTFRFILNEAAEIGIYRPIDYSLTPATYCNDMKINYNPLFEDEI